MANTKSARKAARKIARRTEINKARRSRMRSAVRNVEEAITSGDKNKALEAMKNAEPALMRAAQQARCTRTPRAARSRAFRTRSPSSASNPGKLSGPHAELCA